MHKPAVGRSLLAATLLALTPPHAPAQTNVVPAAAPTLAFDIVSVKRTKTISDKETIESPPDRDGITIQNLTMLGIIEFAYNFRRSELISGLPQWAKTQRYDLLAKVADPDVAAFHKLNQEQRRLMLQALLANEFQLKAHREQKEVPIYALLVGKNGLKMKQAMPGDKYPNGMKLRDGTPAGPGVLMGPTGQGVPMSALVLMLSRLGLDREVVDKTGLTGTYDFSLRFAPEPGSVPVINGQPAAVLADDAAQPSIFTVVQEQLGLRLEPTRGLVEVFVLDHIEPLSEN